MEKFLKLFLLGIAGYAVTIYLVILSLAEDPGKMLNPLEWETRTLWHWLVVVWIMATATAIIGNWQKKPPKKEN